MEQRQLVRQPEHRPGLTEFYPERWDDLVLGMVVATKREEVNPHSGNPLGLEGRWVFAGGRHIGPEWTMLWIQLWPGWYASFDPHLCSGLGSVKVIRWPSGQWRFIGESKAFIGTGVHVPLSEPPPERLWQFFEVMPSDDGRSER
jgi:hypothetical protein